MQQLQQHLSNTPRPAIFIIADISGYTRFMLSNRESLLHGQIIISELMRSILKQAKIPLEIAKLEGDAVFMYCLKPGDRLGSDRAHSMQIQELGSRLLEFMSAFMDKLRALYRANTCSCSACSNLEALRLKIVVHSGEALFYRINQFQELSGPDVIIVHRLLKNSVETRQYILLTAAAAQDLKFPKAMKFRRGVEHYNDIGSIKTLLHELPDQPLSQERLSQHHALSDLLSNPATTATTTVHQWQHSLWMMGRSLLLSLQVQRLPLLSRLPVPRLSRSQISRSQLSRSQPWKTSGRSPWIIGTTLLRWGISAVFFLGGIKLAFPADPAALAQSYVDPETGFISEFFADQIVNRLGLSISQLLRMQGILEIMMAAMNLVWGAHTPMVNLMLGMMLWFFTVAHPGVGAISLSRDLALAGFCLAIALTGPAAWSRDGSFRRQNIVLLLIRLGLSYTLIASALFPTGTMANVLNTTLPVSAVLGLGLALGLGVATRIVSAFVAVWLLLIISVQVWEAGHLYWGLEAVKRELALMVGAGVFAALGRDRWSWPKVAAIRQTGLS